MKTVAGGRPTGLLLLAAPASLLIALTFGSVMLSQYSFGRVMPRRWPSSICASRAP